MTNKWVILLFALKAVFSLNACAQIELSEQVKKSTVSVVAFRTNGEALGGAPEIDVFEDVRTKVDWSKKFRNGVGSDIPYGTYRLEVKKMLTSSGRSYFIPEARYVSISQPEKTIIIGFDSQLYGPLIGPGKLTGMVSGDLPDGKQVFVRMVGLHSNVSVESSLDSNRRFEMDGLTFGPFLLTVFTNKLMLASKWVMLPSDMPSKSAGPFQVVIGRDQVVPYR